MTYGVNVGNAVVDVDDWRPDAYFDLGTSIDVPITIRSFTSRAGKACISLTRFRGEKGAF